MPPGKENIDIKKITDYVDNKDLASIKSLVAKYKATLANPQLVKSDDTIIEALRKAILLERVGIVRYFVEEEGVSPNLIVSARNGLKYAIEFAAEQGNLAIVKIIIEAGKNNKNLFHGMLPAVTKNQTKVALYLLEKGANPNEYVNFLGRETLLMRAAVNGNERLVEALIAKGACVKTALNGLADKYRPEAADYKTLIEEQVRSCKTTAFILSEDSYGEGFWANQLAISEAKLTELERRLQKFEKKHYQAMRILLDHSVGLDFSESTNPLVSVWRSELSFLKDMNISGLNLIVSVDGRPVTYELLIDLGFHGAKGALLTLKDIAALDDKRRKTALTQRVEQKLQQQCGCTNWSGAINLVPLWKAAAIGDANTVETRLRAGIDPNEQGIDIPIIVAAEKGHMEVIRLLASHPQINKQDVMTAVLKAMNHEFFVIADYLRDHLDINTQDEISTSSQTPDSPLRSRSIFQPSEGVGTSSAVVENAGYVLSETSRAPRP